MIRSHGWTVRFKLGWSHLALFLAAIVLAVTIIAKTAFRLGQGATEGVTAAAHSGAPTEVAFAPPAVSTIPKGHTGDSIRRGEAIFTHTRATAAAFVGNGLACSNCHLDAGRTANAAPMWAAWVNYPAYREKNKRVNTMEDRISDCFLYSMNAPASQSKRPPPAGDQIYRDLEMYFAWLATGARSGSQMKGRGYLKLASTRLGYDPARGGSVFAAKCAACHGPHGEGKKSPDGSYAFPSLAGPASFNWGAGMTSVTTLAGFVKANMPLDQGYSLSDQDAWDVAAFVDSRVRPRDPRQTGSIEDARERYHAKGDYYGKTIK